MALVIAMLAVAGSAMSTYDYSFTVNEDPLLDGGKWKAPPATWSHNVKVVGNRAQGPGSSSTNDAVRFLTDTAGGGASWGPNQTATVTYRLSGTDIDAEAEVHLRGNQTSAPDTITTIECDFIPSSHTTVIATWNGNQGDFTAFGDYGNTDPQVDGDVWEYAVTGSSPNIQVAAKKNTVSVGTVTGITGAAVNGGNPGIGFDANSTDGTVWTISHFNVTDGVGTPFPGLLSIPLTFIIVG
jgi:hypothetical protein